MKQREYLECKCGNKDITTMWIKHDFMEKGFTGVRCNICGSKWTFNIEHNVDSRDLTSVECKLCNKTMPPKSLIEHVVLEHDDPTAKKLLEDLNRLRGMGT